MDKWIPPQIAIENNLPETVFYVKEDAAAVISVLLGITVFVLIMRNLETG